MSPRAGPLADECAYDSRGVRLRLLPSTRALRSDGEGRRFSSRFVGEVRFRFQLAEAMAKRGHRSYGTNYW